MEIDITYLNGDILNLVSITEFHIIDNNIIANQSYNDCTIIPAKCVNKLIITQTNIKEK